MKNNEKELDERELKERELMSENEDRRFYVYVHIRLDNNTVFYVGKGTGKRAYDPYRNLHHDNICDACGYEVVKIKENLTESQAYRLENKMIKYYVHTLGYGIDIEGYDDYDHKLPHLTNKDWGGIGGKSGVQHTEEHNKKISEAMKGNVPWNKGVQLSEEHKQNLSESHKRENLSEETIQKMSESHQGMHHSEETKQRIREGNKGKKRSEESKRKNSESHQGKHHSYETKLKMSESHKGKTTGEKSGMWGKPAPNRRNVICITTGKIFDCITEAGDWYNVSISSISLCCKGKYKHAGELNGIKLQWKYAEDDDNESKAV